MRSWTKKMQDAETAEAKRAIVERHLVSLTTWGGRLSETELAVLDTARAEELRAAYRVADEETRVRAEAERRRIEDERKAAPFGRCAFSGEPLADPGTLTYKQAEKRFGWAPCQVRYGRWPNGARVKNV
jgi:hypothetical protein